MRRLTILSAVFVFLLLARSAQAQLAMGLAGDSLTDDYLAGPKSVNNDLAAYSWGQILAFTRKDYVNLGSYRRTTYYWDINVRYLGHEYNWATSGGAASRSTRANVTGYGMIALTFFGASYLDMQVAGLANLVRDGKIDTAFIGIGSNDFFYRTNVMDSSGTYQLNPAAVVDAAFVNEVVNSILTQVDILQAAGPVDIVLGLIPRGTVNGSTPEILAGIDAANTLLTQGATQRGIPVVDLFAWQQDPARVDVDGIISIGDLRIPQNSAASAADVAPGGPGPCNTAGCALASHANNFFADDGLHPNTAIQALIANEVLKVMNAFYGSAIPLLTDDEIITLVKMVACQSDADGDGIASGPASCVEQACSTGQKRIPLLSTSYVTCVAETESDNCPSAVNANQLDTDGDLQGNVCDPDDDGDGLNDGADNCPLTSNVNQANRDGDALGDACDSDNDNDGYTDAFDKFPLEPAAALDGDLDGFPNNWNPGCNTACQLASGLSVDNCPAVSNPDQSDQDGDAIGDLCDLDHDNDGLPTAWEELYGLDPLYNDAGDDMDADGFTNLQEYQRGSDPYVPDPSVAVKNDVDADGDSDLFWRDSASGSNVVWIMQNGTRAASNVLGSNATTYTVEAIADFDADGDDDVLFRNNSTGQSIVWTLQNGVKVGATVLGTNAATYSIKGVADFDGDGDADILFRDTSGNNVIWTTQNAAKVGAVVLGANAAAFTVEATKDFDNDGDADILFRNNTTGQSIIWTLQNAAKTGAVVLGTNATTYSINGVADFNNDGDNDILFRDGTGSNIVWIIQNAAKTGSVVLGSNASTYSVAATADFDNDGDADILFRDTAGSNVIWVMQNHAKTGASVLGSNAATYSVVGTADFDGDGDADILFRDNSSGANVVWIIQVNAKAAANVLSTNAATMGARFEK